MASFKSHPLFYTSLLLAGALTAGQAWLLFSQNSATKRIRAEIAQKQQELQSFASRNPFPSRENQVAVEIDRARVEKTRDEIRERLRATGDVADKIASAPVPTTSTEAYFDIANFIESIRQTATDANVVVTPDNRFGFSAYSSTGPERDLISTVFQQKLYGEYLLSALLKSAPSSVVSLQRERPLSPDQKLQIAEAVAAGQQAPTFGDNSVAKDYFIMDSKTSARVADFVETVPFRLTFTGLTSSLRSFLNELVTFKVPVVVRSVEVIPVLQTTTRNLPSTRRLASQSIANLSNGSEVIPANTEEAKALVEPGESRFIVTVEIISLVDKTVTESTPPAPESASPDPASTP